MNATFPFGNAISKTLFTESVPDYIGQAERNELAQEFCAVSIKAEVVEEILLARHDVADFERAHDLTKLGGGHVANVTSFEIDFDMPDELLQIHDPIEDSGEVVSVDEEVREVYNVLFHFYLLSRDFPSPVWIAIPRHSVPCDMSQRSSLTATIENYSISKLYHYNKYCQCIIQNSLSSKMQ